MSQTAHELLADYGKTAGIESLNFDGNGCARLMFEEHVAVDLEIDEALQCIQVYSVLGPVPPGERETLYRNLLEGNLFGQQTGGAILAIDPVREEVLLCTRVVPETASASDLESLLGHFAAAAGDWQRRFAAGELVQTGSGTDDEPLNASRWSPQFVTG